MISRHTQEGVYTYASPACRALLGYEPEELVGRSAYEFFHPEDLAVVQGTHAAIMELPDTRTVSYRIRRKDGSYVWFETTSLTVRDDGAGATEIVAVSRDITARKQAEKELRESNERITDVLESITDAFFALDHERRFTFVNRRAEQFLGRPREELLGTSVLDAFPESAGSGFQIHGQKAAESGEPTHFEEFYPPLDAWFDVRVYPSREGLAVYFQDVTERKRAEQELRDYAQLLSEVVATQQEIATAELDYQAVMRLIAERSQKLTGASGAIIELIEGRELVYHSGSGSLSRHSGIRLDISASISGMCVREGEPLYSKDTECDPRVDREACRRTGSRSLIVVPLHHAQETAGVLKVVSADPDAFDDRDVHTLQLMAGLIAAAMSHAAEFATKQNLLSERTAALTSIQQSEARFRAIFEDTAAGIAIVSLDGRLLQSNPALQRMLLYSGAELENIHLADLTHPEDVEEDLRLYRELISGRRDNYQMEKRYVRKDGGELWGRLNVSLVRNPAGTPHFAIGMVEDVTERKRAEKEVQDRTQQQAMVAQLGQRALATTDLPLLMDEAVRLVSRNLETEYAGILKLLPEADRFLLQAGVGWEGDIVGETTVSRSEHSTASRALAGEPVVYEDLGSDTRFDQKRVLLDRGIVSGMYVVVHGQERPFGVLGTHTTRRRKFTGDDVNFVQSVANVLAAAIERREYEEALERSGREYRRLFEMASDAILVYEPESREVLDVNDSACEMYELSRDEFLGKTMKELSLDRQRARRYLDTLLERGTYQDFETVHRRADGMPLDVVVNSSVIEFAGRRAVLSIVRDVTSRKRAEQSFNELREAERRRIARDLHDVVLQDLSGALQALQATRLETSGSGVDLEREIEALRRAVGGLRNAVYDLRIEKEQPFLKSVESLVELNRQMRPACRITLTVQEGFPEELEAGVELLRVLQEALANTRNHSDSRSVEVRLSREDGELRAEVLDDGRGFDLRTVPNGVGLSGMRERVRAFGGRLEVRSEPGRGTSVRATLPL